MKKLLLTLSLTLLLVIPTAMHAAAGENVYGYAWSMNTGWIKLNDCQLANNGSLDCDSANGTSPAYGVNIKSNGDFEGYGWSPNVGWVDFSGGTCGASAHATFTSDGSATISGWIQVLSADDAGNNSGGWDGCIKMSGTTANGGTYGVTIAPTGGASQQLSGYGWNANSSTTPNGFEQAVGESWVSFSNAYYISEAASIDLSIDHWSTSCSPSNNQVNLTWTTTGITAGSCSWTSSLSGSAANTGNNQLFSLGAPQSNFNITLSCNSASSGTISDTATVSCSACSDGKDNDDDSLVDSADPGCHNYCDPSHPYLSSSTTELDLTPLQILALCSGTTNTPSTAPKYEER